eukprot:jgi/Chrpa1/5107/Chrysochromulina_OHIO_Genome00010305-RA
MSSTTPLASHPTPISCREEPSHLPSTHVECLRWTATRSWCRTSPKSSPSVTSSLPGWWRVRLRRGTSLSKRRPSWPRTSSLHAAGSRSSRWVSPPRNAEGFSRLDPTTARVISTTLSSRSAWSP